MGSHERAPAPDHGYIDRQLALFRASVLKQAKWHRLADAVGDTGDLTALDLGSDNGVISWMFRQRGGRWTSADLTDHTVAAIRRMVGDRVVRLDGAVLPFADGAFDVVVVVDLLEHVADDRALLAEIGRVLRRGGRGVINVPHVPRGRVVPRILPAIRHAIGLTDAWHGHVRPGYDVEGLRRLLPPSLRLNSARQYSKSFSYTLDTALNWAYLRGTRGRARSSAKGMMVTGDDIGRGGSLLRVASLPMRLFASLDALLPLGAGYSLIVTVERVDG